MLIYFTNFDSLSHTFFHPQPPKKRGKIRSASAAILARKVRRAFVGKWKSRRKEKCLKVKNHTALLKNYPAVRDGIQNWRTSIFPKGEGGKGVFFRGCAEKSETKDRENCFQFFLKFSFNIVKIKKKNSFEISPLHIFPDFLKIFC